MSGQTRRAFLGAVAALGCRTAGSPAPADPVEPPPDPPKDRWDPPGRIDLGRFGCGLQTGDPLPDAVLVSVRTAAVPEVVLRVARWTGTWEELDPVGPLRADDDVVQVELVDLAPDTVYNVVATTPDGARRSEAARFATAPRPGTSRTVRFAATCCFGHTGAPHRSASRVSALALDFVLLLGDTIYATEGAWDAGWTKGLGGDGLRALLLSAPVVATWDDHEVLNDWVWEQSADAAMVALDAFRRALPQRIGPGGSGIWRRLAFGDRVEVFVLDTRGERIGGEILSPEQLEWLIDGVQSSPARWKVVANSVPLTDLRGVWWDGASGGWGPFPAQRAQVLAALGARTDVVWLSGDVHLGGTAWMGPPGTPEDGIREIWCGPAGSKISGYDPAAPTTGQYQFVEAWNTVVVEVGEDEVDVVFHGDDGPIRSLKLLRS